MSVSARSAGSARRTYIISLFSLPSEYYDGVTRLHITRTRETTHLPVLVPWRARQDMPKLEFIRLLVGVLL